MHRSYNAPEADLDRSSVVKGKRLSGGCRNDLARLGCGSVYDAVTPDVRGELWMGLILQKLGRCLLGFFHSSKLTQLTCLNQTIILHITKSGPAVLHA